MLRYLPPVSNENNGNAAGQTLHYRTLLNWQKGGLRVTGGNQTVEGLRFRC